MHEVKINLKHHRFEIVINNHLSKIPFIIRGNTIALFKTEVADELKGKGIAVNLVEYALTHAKENHLKILVFCPYIKSYIEKHPEWKSHIKSYHWSDHLFLLQFYFAKY